MVHIKKHHTGASYPKREIEHRYAAGRPVDYVRNGQTGQPTAIIRNSRESSNCVILDEERKVPMERQIMEACMGRLPRKTRVDSRQYRMIPMEESDIKDSMRFDLYEESLF